MRPCNWALALVGCAGIEPAAPLPNDAAGPPTITFTYTRPTYRGTPGSYVVDAPGGGAFEVLVAVGNRSGQQTCLAQPAVCFDLEAAQVILGGHADASGHYEAVYTEGTRPWPGIPPRDIQAMVVFPDGSVSAVGARSWMQLRGQPHGWFSWWEELWFNLGDLSRDRDSGGTNDFQELRFDRTSLTDPNDDVPVERDCLNDGDGDGDAEGDPDCRPELAPTEYRCDDGQDDDEDGLDDCADPDCALFNPCGEAACDDGLDDDLDGLVDCADPDCGVSVCKDDVVAWLDVGSYRLIPTANGITWMAPPEGGATATVGGGALPCMWDAYNGTPAWACGLREIPEPDPTTLRFDPAIGLMRADGTVLATPRGMVRNEYRVWVDAPVPFADCRDGSAPATFWRDADGDGFAVDPSVPGTDTHEVLACATSVVGFSPVRGDCHDGDPTWTPTTVTLAPGAGCAQVSLIDHDGDGVDRFHDADDRDGGVQ